MDDWRTSIRVGDHLLKEQAGIHLYQEVKGMTRTPSKTRLVEGFSAGCHYGDLGETYIANVVCLIDPEAWAHLKGLGWPARIDDRSRLAVAQRERDSSTAPTLVLLPKAGDCYEANGRWLLAHPDPDLVLVHGIVAGQGALAGQTFGHAWVESPTGLVVDVANGRDIRMPKATYYALGRIGDVGPVRRYTYNEVLRLTVETEHWGPWDGEVAR